MQKTLFDYLQKGVGGNRSAYTATPIAAVPAGRVRPRQPVPESSDGGTTDESGSSHGKIARREDERSPLGARGGKTTNGASRDDAVDLDASVSVPVAESKDHEGGDGGSVSSARGIPKGTAVATDAAATTSLPSTPCATASPFSSCATSSHWLRDLITNREWRDFLAPITSDSWRNGGFVRIERFLDAEQQHGKIILPPAADIFNAFNSCPFRDVKVILLGQDPYHDLHQAHGLCFSVLPGVPLPPSLRNMYKELSTDIECFQAPTHGYLQSWSEQGMLMLNATLTVEAHKANSHSEASGWPAFTDAVIEHLSQHHPNRLVFLLWGNYARKKMKLIDARRHIVLQSVHPSPLSASRGWFGCRCFSACNDALRSVGHSPMQWQLPMKVSLDGR